jgi:hypothetical protein
MKKVIGTIIFSLVFGLSIHTVNSQIVTFPTKNLAPGSSGDAVCQLQQYLLARHYLTQADINTNPPGQCIYGPRTQAAVANLQNELGTEVGSYAGYYGPHTISDLQNEPPVDAYGGYPTQQVQDFLAQQGYTIPSSEYGVGGPATQAAYAQWQNGQPPLSPLPEIFSFSNQPGTLPFVNNPTSYLPGGTQTTGPGVAPNTAIGSGSACNGGTLGSNLPGLTTSRFSNKITYFASNEPGADSSTASGYSATGRNLRYSLIPSQVGSAAATGQNPQFKPGTVLAIRSPNDNLYHPYVIVDNNLNDPKNPGSIDIYYPFPTTAPIAQSYYPGKNWSPQTQVELNLFEGLPNYRSDNYILYRSGEIPPSKWFDFNNYCLQINYLNGNIKTAS